MSYDALTISAIVVVVILIAVIIIIGRNKADIEHRMKVLARQLTLLEANEKAIEICKVIHKKYPELCIGVDFTLRESKDGVKIDKWNSDNPKPKS